ncbi:MAG: hypothetical protein DBP02_07620 [gamma proteobacterium symbiont of Ctena orbiculata]|nr:MAG: hypothetical protein DBP02_07620 [gamma proteobacterium symbiont of Ctena orbiculata]
MVNSLKIADDIEVVVLDIRGNHVRLGIDALYKVAILQEELYEAYWTGLFDLVGTGRVCCT